MVPLKHSVINSLMTKLSWLKITLLLLKFQSSHMSSHGYGIIKNSKIWLILKLLLILNLILWWMLSSLVNNHSLLQQPLLLSWIPLSKKNSVLGNNLPQKLMICGLVLLTLRWPKKDRLVCKTTISSILICYSIPLKCPLMRSKHMVASYMHVTLPVL